MAGSHLAGGPCDTRRPQAHAKPSPNLPGPTAPNTTTATEAKPSPEASSPTAPNTTTPTPSEEQQMNNYFNAGTQDIKGLTNQTGYIKGNANGVINFGTLTSSTAQRQA